MSKPTRGQWRGYAILSAFLSALILALIFWPSKVQPPAHSDYSQLSEAVSRYGQQIRFEDSAHRNYYIKKTYHHRDSFGTLKSKGWERRTSVNPYDTLIVDINTADTSTLQQLRGIGPVFASRIVKYRNRLGGFVSTNQLLEVYGMSEERFNAIEPHLSLSDSHIKLIPVNSASLDELRRHPYIDYYQARAIIDFRNSVGPLRSHDDLLKIPLLDEITIRKITPYIQYNP